MIQDKKLTRKTVVKLLNEIFTLDKKGNENRIENFASENNLDLFKIVDFGLVNLLRIFVVYIRFTNLNHKRLFRINNPDLFNFFDFGQSRLFFYLQYHRLDKSF